MSACLAQNQITNKDLFERLRLFSQQQTPLPVRSTTNRTAPTKATGEDQSLRDGPFGAEKHEAQLKRDAFNLTQ